ncbi:MAG: alpha/beta hydrolase [Myxococcota bacterium]
MTDVFRYASREGVAADGLPYRLYVPSGVNRGPVLVAIHGISRNVDEHFDVFVPVAERLGCALVTPLFDEVRFEDYQRLGRRGRGARADLALRNLLEEIRGGLWHGTTVWLFGYSGGAQFAHRYAMAHPEDVRGAVLASAGWYTFPDRARAYPYGLRLGAELAAATLRPGAFLRVPMLALVGDRDTERDDALRSGPGIDRRQGWDRVERARRWVSAMRDAAIERALEPRVHFSTLPGVGHSFPEAVKAGLAERVFEFLSTDAPTTGAR